MGGCSQPLIDGVLTHVEARSHIALLPPRKKPSLPPVATRLKCLRTTPCPKSSLRRGGAHIALSRPAPPPTTTRRRRPGPIATRKGGYRFGPARAPLWPDWTSGFLRTSSKGRGGKRDNAIPRQASATRHIAEYPQERINKAIDSFPKRTRACREGCGGYFGRRLSKRGEG